MQHGKTAYILSIDQSTQGTKAILLDGDGRLVLRRDLPHRQIIHERGWVGHDAREIAANVLRVARTVITDSGIDRRRLCAVAVTNQRESVAVWERDTGEPVCESIVWQCNRAAQLCAQIRETGVAEQVRQRTGLFLSPFFSASKVAWVLDNIPGVRERAERGGICAGTMDCWTIWQLTGGKVHRTDCSNASRTQMFNIHTLAWDEELCRIFRIPPSVLPEVCDSDAVYGETDLAGFLDHPIPIRSAIGDSHAALFAHGCFEEGGCMAGHGTGTCVMMNIGGAPIPSTHGINTTVAWRMNGQAAYALEGVVNYAGAVTTWMKDSVGLVRTPEETEALSFAADPNDRTYLVPAFTGIGAPHWDDGASACYVGMTRLTGRAELVRAGIESIGYQVADIIGAMELDAGLRAGEVRMAGGPTGNKYLMQFQSDILDRPVALGAYEELVAVGAGQIAGLAMGLYDRAALERLRSLRYYRPAMQPQVRQAKLAGWQDAVSRALSR